MTKREARRQARRRAQRRRIALTLTLVLVVAFCAVGGTIAWLTDSTAPVVNTFTVGNIDIELAETTGTTYHILPGNDITKDPEVTVKANSEASWLYVKVEEANWPTPVEEDGSRKVDYAIADGWTLVDGQTNVYYREVAATTADTDFAVLLNNTVEVSENLTKTEMNAITTPTLTFTAYAIQKDDNVASAADGWAKVQG